MFRKTFSLYIVLVSMLLSSCFKEDERVIPHIPGNYTSDTIVLTDSYKNQVYYNLLDSNDVITNYKDSWDLGFESTPSGWRVTLNSSCFMKSAYLEGQDFGYPVDTTGAVWLFNPSDGSADSLAIGQWFTIRGNDTVGANRLMLIDRGIDIFGNSRGYSQLVIDSLVLGTYYFRIAGMNGANAHSYAVRKNSSVNHVFFSIKNPSDVIAEPATLSWDLLFTQYTTLLYTDAGDPYPYLVTGVLLNPASVQVAVDSLTSFEEIDFDFAQQMTFTSKADRIGYDWKRYDFDQGTYTVNSNLVYIIRDTKGFLYKFRFVGFYKTVNNKSEKGFPSFEYQRL